MKSKVLLFFFYLWIGFSQILARPSNELAGVVIHGKVLDSKTRQPVSGSVTIYLDSDIIKERMDLEYGEFSEALEDYGWYLIKISARGYVEVTDTLWVLNDLRTDIRRDYYLIPQTVSNIFANHIYFEKNKSILSTEAVSELDNVVKFLLDNPEMSCEISGHADRTGASDYNLALSEDRAYTVFDYLMDKGIDRARLRTFGYGEALPEDDRETNEALAKNRRVEISPFRNDSSEMFPVFNNVYFDFGKSNLSNINERELENVINYLKENPHATCEIAGHADNVGTVEINLLISQRRAENLVLYLTSKGIDGARMKARGYGFSRPLESNLTTEGRAKNRRVEFNIRNI